jgi:hypothetical protein
MIEVILVKLRRSLKATLLVNPPRGTNHERGKPGCVAVVRETGRI